MATATKSPKKPKTATAKPRTTGAKTPARPAPSAPAASGGAPVSGAVALPKDMKKKELIEVVTAATGLKRGDAKVAVEATLAAIAREVAAGRSVQTPELGRLRVVKQVEKGNGAVSVCRLRAPRPKVSNDG